MRAHAPSLDAMIAPAVGSACTGWSGGLSALGGVAMTATLERLEELVETLLQQLERELDAQCPPRPERPLLRLVDNEEVSDDG
jgi:hypothetical protein